MENAVNKSATHPSLLKIEQSITEHVSEDNKEDFQNAVIAGMTILFDPKTHSHLELIKNPESRKNPVETISKGVAGLGWILYMQSKQTMESEVLVMASLVLMVKTLDFAQQGLGIPVDDQMIADISEKLAENLFRKMGVSPEQLQEAIQSGQKEIDDYKSREAANDESIGEQPANDNGVSEQPPFARTPYNKPGMVSA